MLRIADNLSLPLDVVTQKLAFLGRTGSGKTYGATKLAELMLNAEAQVIAIDPVGVWYGLRLAADGKSPGLSIPVFGGLHGDIPLEPTAGKLIADLIIDRGISVVLDVSQFESDADKAKFGKDWAARFFFRKKAAPSAVHVFIEEAQEFIPQNYQRGEEQMLHAFQRLVRLGRNFGVGVSILSQRPQDVHKKALNQTECVFAFQTTGPHERKAIDGWITEKGLDLDIANDLPKLAIGQPHVWSPQWLDISKTVRITPKKTFNASATPTVGARAQVRELAPIDLEKLRKDMAGTIERARAEDPRELRRRIAELEREITGWERKVVTKEVRKEIPSEYWKILEEAMKFVVKIESTDVIVTDPEQIAEAVKKAVENTVKEINREIENRLKATQRDAIRVKQLIERLSDKGTVELRVSLKEEAGPSTTIRPRSSTKLPPIHVQNGDERLGKCETKILATLAQHGECDIKRLAVLSGYRRSGGFKNSISRLRTLGYLDGPNTGIMRATDAGLKAGEFDALPTGRDLYQYWLNSPRMGVCERRIMEVLDGGENGLTLEEIAEASEYAVSGGFKNSLSKLRTAGVIVGRNTERMRLSEELL